MAYRHRKLTKPRIFALLMLLGGLMLMLPRGLFAPVRNATQLVAYLPQWGSQQVTHQLRTQLESIGAEPVAPEEHDKVVRENLALQNENVALRQKVAELRATVDALGRIRQLGFPATGALIPARVLGADASVGRESLLLGKGSTQQIKNQDWVTSRMAIGAGTQDGIMDRSAVLARESLIGWIEETSPITSRVVLLSDRLANRAMSVRIEPVGEKRVPLVSNRKPIEFVLSGAGEGKMHMPDLPRDYIEQGYIRVGDRVTSNPTDPRLPMPLVIGRITHLEHNRKKPVYYDAVVEPLYDPRSINEVYVVDLSRTMQQPAPPAR
jgi:cell shape-determining protein MreC